MKHKNLQNGKYYKLNLRYFDYCPKGYFLSKKIITTSSSKSLLFSCESMHPFRLKLVSEANDPIRKFAIQRESDNKFFIRSMTIEKRGRFKRVTPAFWSTLPPKIDDGSPILEQLEIYGFEYGGGSPYQSVSEELDCKDFNYMINRGCLYSEMKSKEEDLGVNLKLLPMGLIVEDAEDAHNAINSIVGST